MRSISLIFGFVFLAAAAVYRTSRGQDQKPAATAEPSKRIIPVVALKPGETKEQLMCCACGLITRGGGLRVWEIGKPGDSKERTIWKGEGVTVELPKMGEAAQAAGAPAYQALSDKGLSAFVVTVSVAMDAKPRLIEMHLADETCSGTCDTDLRVLVLAQ